MQENDVEHDPANRQEARETPQKGRFARHLGGHAEGQYGDQQSAGQPRCGSDVRFQMEKTQPDEHDHDRYGRDQSGQRSAALLVSWHLPCENPCEFSEISEFSSLPFYFTREL